MVAKFTNNASTTIAAAITTSSTTITLASGAGALFPSLGTTDYFWATLIDSSNNLEVVKVTARSGDTLTVMRGQDGTMALAYAAGSKIEERVVAADMNEIETNVSANTSSISAETARATTAESTETTRAQGAESAISTSVSTETARAQGAESTNANAIAAEAARAKAAEAAIPWASISGRPTALSQFSNDSMVPANIKSAPVSETLGRYAGTSGNCGNIPRSYTSYLNLNNGTYFDLYYITNNCTNCNCNCCCCC